MSDCSCSIDLACDGDLIREGTRVARKAHRCSECRAEIAAGQEYSYYVGTCDGRIYTAKHCRPCAGICRDFFPGGFEFGAMRQDFYDCMGFDYLGEWVPYCEMEERGR